MLVTVAEDCGVLETRAGSDVASVAGSISPSSLCSHQNNNTATHSTTTPSGGSGSSTGGSVRSGTRDKSVTRNKHTCLQESRKSVYFYGIT